MNTLQWIGIGVFVVFIFIPLYVYWLSAIQAGAWYNMLKDKLNLRKDEKNKK